MINYKKDAEEWGIVLNEACWDAIGWWDDNQSLGSMPVVVFNNLKPMIREAILKYISLVEEEGK